MRFEVRNLHPRFGFRDVRIESVVDMIRIVEPGRVN